ncbi:Dihydrofolate reductase [Parafrankia irregularis]|uniref:Dihydrofolate reductase n=1 Tax=Parafrankia irregularis TaxID=795642 RepID=A0A0S4QKK6_9ACTN|nr:MULTISPECIES: dihydrofolate reductase family protein [Parafrankia]MBE3202327.1 dihydrofolate reductase [Parafrankia sp. CH37]CUU56080.1 Dihydrofolate reductase [Parafrankia irregularis]
MRRLVAVEFLSVDGVMQGLGSPDEDRDGGFEHGGWGVPYAEALHEVIDPAGLGGTSAYLFGRRTYEKMAAFWPFQPNDNPMAATLNTTPKYVATRTLSAPLGWEGAEPLDGDLVTAVTRLKNTAGRGDVVVLGSGALVRQLMEVDLVDELRLFVHPLLLGAGKRLFGGLPAPRPLRLTSSGTTSRGTVALTYAVEGRRPAPASV